MSVGPEPVRVELTVFTDSLVIHGSCTTPHRRVTDILNRAKGRFLVLDQVTIEDHGVRGQSSSAQFAQVNLDAILFATADIAHDPDSSTAPVAQPEPAVVCVPPFNVAGNVQLLDREGEARTGRQSAAESFVPVTNAVYWSDQLGAGRRHAPLVAVNHRRVQYLAPHREVDPWAGLTLGRAGGGADPNDELAAGFTNGAVDLEPARER